MSNGIHSPNPSKISRIIEKSSYLHNQSVNNSLDFTLDKSQANKTYLSNGLMNPLESKKVRSGKKGIKINSDANEKRSYLKSSISFYRSNNEYKDMKTKYPPMQNHSLLPISEMDL